MANIQTKKKGVIKDKKCYILVDLKVVKNLYFKLKKNYIIKEMLEGNIPKYTRIIYD